jgi:hypothetical protein
MRPTGPSSQDADRLVSAHDTDRGELAAGVMEPLHLSAQAITVAVGPERVVGVETRADPRDAEHERCTDRKANPQTDSDEMPCLTRRHTPSLLDPEDDGERHAQEKGQREYHTTKFHERFHHPSDRSHSVGP